MQPDDPAGLRLRLLLLRGVAAMLWGVPLLLALGYGRQIPLIFERRVLLRNLLEMTRLEGGAVRLSRELGAIEEPIGTVLAALRDRVETDALLSTHREDAAQALQGLLSFYLHD